MTQPSIARANTRRPRCRLMQDFTCDLVAWEARRDEGFYTRDHRHGRLRDGYARNYLMINGRWQAPILTARLDPSV